MAHYQEAYPITRQEAEEAFSSGHVPRICQALVEIAFHDPDWEWVQSQCLRFGKDPNREIRGLAAICLGHLARIHGVLDMEKVQPLLDELLEDPEVSARAEIALDDIERYLHHK